MPGSTTRRRTGRPACCSASSEATRTVASSRARSPTAAPPWSRTWSSASAPTPATRPTTSRPTGRPSAGRAAGRSAWPGPACTPRSGRRCASRSVASTGREPRRRPTGTGTWTAPCAAASGPRERSWTNYEDPSAAPVFCLLFLVLPSLASAQAPRERWNTKLLARITAPGYPASAYPHPNGRVYVGTYTNPRGDALPSRVSEFNPDTDALLRSWAVPGQDLNAEHGIQAATSDAAGRMVLLDRTPSRVLILDQRTGDFSTYATFRNLAPCTGEPTGNCSPTTQDLAPMANYAAWGPGGELYVTDFQQGVVWRVPPGGGDAEVWLADRRLDGQMFGTTGIAWPRIAGR